MVIAIQGSRKKKTKTNTTTTKKNTDKKIRNA